MAESYPVVGSAQAGGHLIDRHVAKSESDLAARLAQNPQIPAASTFENLA